MNESEQCGEMEILEGDLLDFADRGLIVHQCNCRTTSGRGLSAQIFSRFPQADVYSRRQTRKPGKVDIFSPVANLYGQDRPGKSKTEPRQEWFLECLENLSILLNLSDIEELFFPFGIGCGLAGGDWNWYREAVENWAKDQFQTVYWVRRK